MSISMMSCPFWETCGWRTALAPPYTGYTLLPYCPPALCLMSRYHTQYVQSFRFDLTRNRPIAHRARHTSAPPAHPWLCHLPLLPCISSSHSCLYIHCDLSVPSRLNVTQNSVCRTIWRTCPRIDFRLDFLLNFMALVIQSQWLSFNWHLTCLQVHYDRIPACEP
jgi:hypothetical protein